MVEGDDILDEEDCLPQLVLVVEDFHCLHALDELDVLGELVELEEELEELDDARELEIFVHELLREVLLHVHELVGLDWLRLDLNPAGLVAHQVLELTEFLFLSLCLGILCNLV